MFLKEAEKKTQEEKEEISDREMNIWESFRYENKRSYGKTFRNREEK